METMDDGVYVFTNKGSGTCLELSAGSSSQGTAVLACKPSMDEASYFNQNWLIRYQREKKAYTFQNVRGGTFMELRGGLTANGTAIQGSSEAQSPQDKDGQLWCLDYLEDGSGAYRIVSRKSEKIVVEVPHANTTSGTKVNVWEVHDLPHHAWYLERRDRHGFHLEELLSDNPFIRQQFRPFKSNVLYLVCPQKVIRTLCDQKGIMRRQKAKATYDCDDFAYSMKAAVGEWTHDNVKVQIGVVFGIMYGTLAAGNKDGKYAYNWTPTHDWSSIEFFEPETGKFLKDIGYHAYLCLL